MSKDPHPASSASSHRTGAGVRRMLAGHQVVCALGKGGLGEVYEALSPDGRTVAIKAFLLNDDDQGLLAAAFVREANVGQRLHHPDIVKVLDSGCDRQYAYLVMELVPGHDLRPHTQPGQLLPVDEVLRIIERVARALAHAHALNVVHRDIKPGNVLVDAPSDTVKLADFGLARLGDVFRSRTGIMAGTPGYMSPEQLAEGPIDHRSDLYSLGVVLFEMLTGRLPHDASSFGQLLTEVANRTAVRVSTLRPGLPPGLSALVAELLEKRTDRRPDSALSVAERLAQLRVRRPQSGLTAAAGPISRA